MYELIVSVIVVPNVLFQPVLVVKVNGDLDCVP